MFGYNLRLCYLSIRKTPILSLLMVAAIGMGIGVCMTILTVYTLTSRDPIPQESDRLYTYTLDNHLHPEKGQELEDPQPLVGYRDVMNLRKSTIPGMQSIHYQSSGVFQPANPDLKPFRDTVRLATNGFFAMFDVSFRYGGPWTDAAARGRSFVTVLTSSLNDRLFGGANSVGKTVDMNGRDFTVVGVMGDFTPIPRYFELDGGAFQDVTGMFIPFSLTPVLQMRKANGSVDCSADINGNDFRAFLDAECRWIHHWVRLDTRADRDAYLSMLNRYAIEQRKFGRFQGPFRNRLFNVAQFLEFRKVVNPAYVMLISIAFMFLAVCLLNTAGLLLAKFSGRAGEISVRRALGCSKLDVLYRHLVEVGVIGLSGGILGLVLAALGLLALRKMFPGYEHLVHLDIELGGMALALATGTTLLAGLYPAWRTSRLPPATYLKAQ